MMALCHDCGKRVELALIKWRKRLTRREGGATRYEAAPVCPACDALPGRR